MSKEVGEFQNVLNVNLSEKFVPAESEYKTKTNNFPATIRYWVTCSNGEVKNYLQATPREVLDWANRIFPKDIPSKYRRLLDEFNEENLLLENYKAYYIGTVLRAIDESGIYSLFGKKQDWKKIEEWVKTQKEAAKADKENQ